MRASSSFAASSSRAATSVSGADMASATVLGACPGSTSGSGGATTKGASGWAVEAIKGVAAGARSLGNLRRAGFARGFGAGGTTVATAGSGGRGSTSRRPVAGAGVGGGAGTGSGGGSGGSAAAGVSGTGTGTGAGTGSGSGASVTWIGPLGPLSKPGTPNCSDSSSPCSSTEIPIPVTSRRSRWARESFGRGSCARGMPWLGSEYCQAGIIAFTQQYGERARLNRFPRTG